MLFHSGRIVDYFNVTYHTSDTSQVSMYCLLMKEIVRTHGNRLNFVILFLYINALVQNF